MPSRRPTARLAAAGIGLLLAAGATGCAGSDDGPQTRAGASAPAGSVEPPSALVLPDSLAVSPDGEEVLADCWSGLCRWSAEDGRLLGVDDGSHLALSPDWSLRAGAGDDAAVLLLDLDSGDEVAALAGLDDAEVTDGSPVTAIAFSPDGSLVAGAGPGGEVVVWEVADGGEVARLQAGAEVWALAFSPDGGRLAATGSAPAEVFDLATEQALGPLEGATAGVALAWSPDGRWLAASGPDDAPTVWRAGDLSPAGRLDGLAVHRLAFAPDSRTIAVTAMDDPVVRLWPAGSWPDRARRLAGHTAPPEAVAFTPDGGRLFSASAADGVLGWNVRTGRVAVELERPPAVSRARRTGPVNRGDAVRPLG